MAEKKNGKTEGEAAIKKPPAVRENPYHKLQSERRKLEAELSSMEANIRDAINAGDVEAMEKLTARQAELPALFVAASMAETSARNDLFNAEDKVNLEALKSAQDALIAAQAAHARCQEAYEIEIAELNAKVLAAENAVGEVYAAINASRSLGAAYEAGFRKSLSTLAGV